VKLGDFAHVNMAECRFSLMKRAVFGTHHSVSEAHLLRHLAGWDLKFNTRKMNDGERATLFAKSAAPLLFLWSPDLHALLVLGWYSENSLGHLNRRLVEFRCFRR